MGNDTVTISRKMYEELIESQRWLTALKSAGVDNWDGYDFAKEILEEWDNDDE